MTAPLADRLTDVPGLTVGHWTDPEALTGCTVVLCQPAAIAGVDVRGSAPGTRETELLRPGMAVERADAIVLSGGSAFGLAAASGVADWLAARGRGHATQAGPVPIVPAAILFDLGVGPIVRPPTAAAGALACDAAGLEIAQGNVGAGTGATVAKLAGLQYAWKGGIGTASDRLDDGTVVGALIAVNAVGDVHDLDGSIIARPRHASGHGATHLLRTGTANPFAATPGQNTTIGVVATSASLSKEQVVKLAALGQGALSIAIRPAHTMLDGDTIFALATGVGAAADAWTFTRIGAVLSEVVQRAIANAVRHATGIPGFPAIGDAR